jgi:NO-binding membrane sensor protein with MHYT domain
VEALLAIKGWIGAAIPAAIGSLLSLYVSKDKTANMKRWELFLVFCFGIALAHYLGGAAIEYSKIDTHSITSDAIKLTIGLLGMATITNIFAQLPLAIEGLRKKWTGV